MTSDKYCKLTGTSQATATRDLADLAEKGLHIPTDTRTQSGVHHARVHSFCRGRARLSAWSYTAQVAFPIGLPLRAVDALVSAGLALPALFVTFIHFV